MEGWCGQIREVRGRSGLDHILVCGGAGESLKPREGIETNLEQGGGTLDGMNQGCECPDLGLKRPLRKSGSR